MLGTAFTQRGVLLVEQPGPWGHKGLQESRFDREIAAKLHDRADAADLRLLAIRRPGRTTPGTPRRWAVAAHAGAPLSWATFERDHELLDVPLDGCAGTPDAAPTYLVCAHSKRDVCCAVAGRPVAAELATLAPGRVWECSHTGGHRFAPIVLALPIGALYGRVDDVSALAAATERGAVLPHLLRGVIGADPVHQAALGYALQRLGLERPDDVRVDARDPGSARVTVNNREYEIRLAVEQVPTPFPSCGKPEPKLETQIRLIEFR